MITDVCKICEDREWIVFVDGVWVHDRGGAFFSHAAKPTTVEPTAGKTARKGISAEQVKSAIIDAISEIEAEATALADCLEKKDLAYPAALVLDAMDTDTKRYRAALDILTEIVERMESEQVMAEVGK